jgi:MFS family permease
LRALQQTRSEFGTRSDPPYGRLVLVGLGGLFAGVTGPLLSAFVPLLVREALGDQRTLIGFIMAIDNILLLALVPWAGAVSDRASALGQGRLGIVLSGFVLAAAGMALFPFSAALGIAGIIAVMVVLYTGINLQRSPFQALLADLVPSLYRPLATASVTFQMCIGAIAFLLLGRVLGMRPAFLIGAGTVLGLAGAFAFAVRGREAPASQAAEVSYRALLEAVWSAVRGVVPGVRTIFIASLLVQLTFQSFTTWFALHATERFGVRPEDVTVGFIAWAVGGVLGAIPAGFIGMRIGRRNTMLLGFALMAATLVALHRVTHVSQATPLLALASASWTLPTVNAFPLFVEPIPRTRRGVLAALFLLCAALGGAIGDPLNGALFDFFDGYRPLFVMMAAYTALAFVAVLLIPRGSGEADTGPSEPQAPTRAGEGT